MRARSAERAGDRPGITPPPSAARGRAGRGVIR